VLALFLGASAFLLRGCGADIFKYPYEHVPVIPDRSARIGPLQASFFVPGRLRARSAYHSPGPANQGQLAYAQKDWGPHDCGVRLATLEATPHKGMHVGSGLSP